MKYKPELVLNSRCILGEGPLWDKESKKLYFIDIIGNKICCLNTMTQLVDEMDCGKNVGTIILSKEYGLIAALQDGLYHLDFAKKQLIFICNPEEDRPNNRFNDGKAAPGGYFIFGSVCMDWDKGYGTNEPLAQLYSMDKDYRVRVIDNDVVNSNGLAWTKDEKTMYFADTPRFKIYAFDYDKKNGMASNKRVVIDVPKEKGYPDGMTIDKEDMLWVCHWGGSAVNRWNPHTGEIIDTIEMPISQPTCCTFAGAHLDEMYITSASIGAEQEEYSGGVFKAKLNISGAAPYVFGE